MNIPLRLIQILNKILPHGSCSLKNKKKIKKKYAIVMNTFSIEAMPIVVWGDFAYQSFDITECDFYRVISINLIGLLYDMC